MGAPSFTPDPGYGALINKLANPPNPLTTLGQDAEALAAAKEFQAQNALTGIYQQSIDPQTGQVDLGEFNALARQNPAALWKFGESMRSAGAGLGAEGQGTSADVASKLDQLAVQQAYMSPLLPKAQAGTLTADDIRTTLKNVPPGVVSPTVMANINQQLDNGDPNAVVLGGYFASQHARDMASMTQPSMGTIQSGSMNYPTQGNMFYPGGPGRPGGIQYPTAPIPQGTQPGGTEIQIGGGRTITVPNDQVHTILSTNPELQRLNPSLGAGGGGAAPAAGGEGRYPQPAAAPGAPAPGPGAPAPPAPAPGAPSPSWLQPPPRNEQAGGVGVTPAPGYAETTKASVAANNNLQAQITAAQDIKPTLADMETQLNQGATSGVGATTVSSLRQLVGNLGLVPKDETATPNTASKQAAQEEFNKDAARLQTFQLSAMGNPTDARQELIETTSPGAGLSKQGNLNIIHMLQGNNQALEAIGGAWKQAQAQGWTPDRYNEWANQHFFTATDPATGGKFNRQVFWFANAPNLAEQKEYFGKIPQGQRQQFLNDLQYAKNQKWITQGADGAAQPGSP